MTHIISIPMKLRPLYRSAFTVAIIFLLGHCQSWGQFWELEPVKLTHIRTIADSGQTQCASGASGNGAFAACPQSLTGQDGDFVNVPTARSFTGPTQHATFSGDYTTIDNVTGLIWKSCGEGYTPDNTCTTAGIVTFARNNTGVDDAANACTALNSRNSGGGYSGHKDWRLPRVDELISILNFGVAAPLIDAANFPATSPNQFWTSNSIVSVPTNGVYVDFSNSFNAGTAKTTALRVRCVAGGSAARNQVLVNNGDGTVTDSINKLIWQRCTIGFNNDATCSASGSTTATWQNSISYCQSLNLAGHTWRLPNAMELISLVDFTVASPSLNATLFPNTVVSVYWTSTTVQATPANAIYVGYTNGDFNTNGKGNTFQLRCVATEP